MNEKKQKHILIVLVLLTFAAGTVYFLGRALQMNPDSHYSPLVGQKAMSFQVVSLNDKTPGKKVTLEDFKGRPLVLNFWASWCFSCREEAGILEAFWQEIQSQNYDVALLGIAATYGKTYPLALDDEGKGSINYGVTGVPETFFIDREGRIRHKITGPVDLVSLRKYKKLLARDETKVTL